VNRRIYALEDRGRDIVAAHRAADLVGEERDVGTTVDGVEDEPIVCGPAPVGEEERRAHDEPICDVSHHAFRRDCCSP
jgi:hypothetical protein